jgi:methylenetetrahydrofolate--tRNA-(uracil-5-)-methyltransferase
MMGALAAYISDPTVTAFQPMGCNMGILPELPVRIRDKKEKYEAYANRAIASMDAYLAAQKG